MVAAEGIDLKPMVRASEPAGEILNGAEDLFTTNVGAIMVASDGIELEPVCGRPSPQARS
jgi:hypothetical protein